MKYATNGFIPKTDAVAPLVGAWIEIDTYRRHSRCYLVAPLVGAWIEIPIVGLTEADHGIVAPLVGAWIEILTPRHPSAGAYLSLLSWERGLK